MIDKLLKAKHWQIFILIFIIPYSLQFIATYISKNDPALALTFTPFIVIIFFICLFSWLYSISAGLQDKVPGNVKMKVKKFKLFLLIPIIYIPLVFSLMSYSVDGLGQSNSPYFALHISTILILHLLSMFGIFYSFYFAAKTYKTVELKRKALFSDFAGDFFLFLFFPIGVWILQPKINLLSI
jgi:hypothetical protein